MKVYQRIPHLCDRKITKFAFFPIIIIDDGDSDSYVVVWLERYTQWQFYDYYDKSFKPYKFGAIGRWKKNYNILYFKLKEL